MNTQTHTVEKAEMRDLPRILEIYAYARNFMRETGNPDQWRNNFPPEALLAEDIKKGNLYVIKEDDAIHAVFFFAIGADPTYAKIEQGEWLSDTEYGTIHRVAGDGTLHGVLGMIVAFCSRKISHLRIDTHEDNKVMQRAISKNGFQKRGIIYIEDGSPRIAYERV